MIFANTPLNSATADSLIKIKILTNDRCEELFENIKRNGCRTSFNAIVTGFMPLALTVAMGYRHRGDINDLFQIACLNLMDATRTFQPERAVHFSTHARTWINLALKRHVLCESGLIKVPDSKGIMKCYRRMHHFSGEQQPPKSVVAQFIKPLGVTADEFKAAYELYFAIYESTSRDTDDDSDSLESNLSNGVTLESEVIAADDERHNIKTVNRLLNVLNDRERTVIKARLLQDEPVQLRVVGEEIGVSSERVRQIEKLAMNKIRMAA
jgi:RNA polymerase sigma factor (sigma-70 family)